MISLDVKPESKSSSPIGLSSSKEKPTLSFSELLKGVKDSKDSKIIQNGAIVLSLDSEQKDTKQTRTASKQETLLSLLKSDEKEIAKETLELHPKITQNLSVKEIKTLVAEAKEFLKTKILESDGYKRAQVKELPKTLKGLAQMAKKFGVDVSKITVEEVRATVKAETTKSLEIAKTKEESKPVEKIKTKDIAKPTETTKPIDNVKLAETSKQKATEKAIDTEDVESKEQVVKKTTHKAEADTDSVIEVKIKDKTQYVKNTKAIDEQKVSEDVKVKEEIKENIKIEDKKVETQKEIKSTPLFKAQEKTELTTEQLVQTKQFKVEEKTPKERADETLKLLLRGEKPTAQTGLNLTSDFSVATARVIAPQAKSEVNKSLEQLLRGEASETQSKTDGLNVHKADSFEVKLNEAKQMIKYLSQDVKTAIEDYKAPFTRIKVQLNPQKLGEVDLTVVQRGKNLHVSLSANNSAINTLSMNANELRTQLANNGINNATLNFNSQDSSHSQAGQQEQHRQREQQAQNEYSYFENEEKSEEILSSLEIVVPNYA